MAVRRIVLLTGAVVAATIAGSVLIAVAVIDDGPSTPPSELPAGVELVYKSFIVPARGTAAGDAICPPGKVATGGGAYSNAVRSTLLVLDSLPVSGKVGGSGRQPRGWRVRYSSRARTVVKAGAVAVCAAAEGPAVQRSTAVRRPPTTTTATTPDRAR